MSKYKSCSKQSDQTFENFITGPENIIAFTAAKIFSDPSVISIPLLVIYGYPGTGKTHLAHAILNQMIPGSKKLNYINVTGDSFINEFITLLGEGKLDKFKKRYRKVDMLIVEGLEFFQSKEETPYELLSIIDHLICSGKRVILITGQNPFTLKLNDGFMKLFKQAQIVKILKPGIDARISFIKQQCLLNKIDLNDEMINYIASRIKSSFRVIEHCLYPVHYRTRILDEPLTFKMIKEEVKRINN